MVLGPGFTPSGDIDVATPDRPGATVVGDAVRFEVWAPTATRVAVEVLDADRGAGPVELDAVGGGAFVATVPGAGHGDRYEIRLDGGEPLADPASRWQPDGVFGPSAVVDPGRFSWTDGGWTGVSLADTVLYELHVGTFTPDGTLDSAIAELPRLAALGVTTVELMPLGQFSGRRGWGYDGVFPNAVQHSYGGPEAMARFVDAAHGVGLAVVVDAIYNHFGPEGCVVDRFGPYTTDQYSSTWAPGMNVFGPGSDQVRRYFVDNARMWIDDFHCDGLRLDAVHAVLDPTARPFFEELISAVHDLGRRAGRTVLAFVESSSNDPRMLAAPPDGWGGDAQWNDEYHHAIRVSLTGDRSGYYVDFDGVADVADVLEHRFAYRGKFSPDRGRRHGRDVSHLEAARFVVSDQNHDQVGNRRDGERLDVLVDLERRKLALAAVLLSPFTPMLFQGEEYGETAPFPFFVDHADPELLDAVRRGRAEEFASFEWEGDPPDPAAIETFRSAILRPEVTAESPHRELLALTTELLRLRREHRALTDPEAEQRVDRDGDVVTLRRSTDVETTELTLWFGVERAADPPGLVLDTADERWAGPGRSPWSVTLSVERR